MVHSHARRDTMRDVVHKASNMGHAKRVMQASDAVVRTLGRRVESAEAGASALAVALARVCVSSDIDLEQQLRLARFVANALEEDPC